MPPRRLFHNDDLPCMDCIHLQNEIDDLREALNDLTQRVTLLTLQMSMIKHDLFGGSSITRLDRNGDIPSDR